MEGLDQVWNLVLACVDCNRGPRGKFDAVPHSTYINRLNTRNNYLIETHRPLADTLKNQTGKTPELRRVFLQAKLDQASQYQPSVWNTQPQGSPAF